MVQISAFRRFETVHQQIRHEVAILHGAVDDRFHVDPLDVDEAMVRRLQTILQTLQDINKTILGERYP